jgi:tetratricopeptide (TPR) repeat protein
MYHLTNTSGISYPEQLLQKEIMVHVSFTLDQAERLGCHLEAQITLLNRMVQFAAKTLKDVKMAEEYLHRATLISVEAFGEASTQAADAYQFQVKFYEKVGELNSAEACQRKLLNYHEHTFGKEHRETAGSYERLAGILKGLNKLDEAESLYQKSMLVLRGFLTEGTKQAIAHEEMLLGVGKE